MKKFVIIAILALILAACAPALPPRTANNTTGTVDTNTSVEPQPAPVKAPVKEPEVSEAPANPEVSEELPKKEVLEGELVDFPNLRAVDPDGDPVEYTFSEPLDENGKWQTEKGDAGTYKVTITASDGVNTVSQDVLIVVTAKNKAPAIELSDSFNITEGETVTLNPKITDEEGDEVSIAYSGWMSSNSKKAGFDDAGSHKVTITASDGSSNTVKVVTINVDNKNRAPSLEVDEGLTVNEGEIVELSVIANDPDGDDVAVIFGEPLDESGAWKTEIGDAGKYSIKVIAKDAELTTEKTVNIVVKALNQAPTIDIAGTISVKEGETVVLNPTIVDEEGDDFTVKYSGWMTSNTKVTGYDDQGNHKVIITAEDSNGNKRSAEIIVSVEDNNRPPTFSDDAFV